MVKTIDPLKYPCPRCRAKIGEPCRNYLGKRKACCPERGRNWPVGPKAKQAELFPGPGEELPPPPGPG
jgi:hypothetical protein